MNLKIVTLLNKLKEMGNLSAATKEAKLWAEGAYHVNIQDIKLAVSIDESPELTESLFDKYQQDVLHIKLNKLAVYINDMNILNDDGSTTPRERETYLATINNMLNQRTLI